MDRPSPEPLPSEREAPDSVVPSFAITLDEARERIRQLQEFIRFFMVEGEDYGRIPGTPKPTLFKPTPKGKTEALPIEDFQKSAPAKKKLRTSDGAKK